MLTMSNLPSALGHDVVKPYLSSCLELGRGPNDLPALQSSAFDDLVSDINRVLGPSNGIDSDGVDVQELMVLMEQYRSCRADWDRFAFADPSRAYTRNLVDRGNGKCNLLILVWTPGKSSPIHDHASAHCVMKVLQGTLTETLYSWPCEQQRSRMSTADQTSTTSLSTAPSTQHACSREYSGDVKMEGGLRIRRQTTYSTDGVTYMSDTLGLHRVGNAHPTEVAVSLHLYTPPNAAKNGCHIFDEGTGKKSHVQQCHFYSELGVKL